MLQPIDQIYILLSYDSAFHSFYAICKGNSKPLITLNCISTRLFVFVPSGQRKSCGSSWSGDNERVLISSFALCLVSGVRLVT